MGKNLLVLAAILTAVALSGSAVFADPFGPPTAGLKMMQNSAGFEYEYSQIDTKATEGSIEMDFFDFDDGFLVPFHSEADLPDFDLKPAKRNKVYAKLGFGMTDDWEIFLRVGAADFKDKTSGAARDGDFGFSGGAGTKITFSKSENGKLAWGALIQSSWAKSEFEKISFNETINGDKFVGTDEARIDYFETQFAVGPTYRPTDGFCIYGGPVISFFRGRIKEDITTTFNNMPASGSAKWKVIGKSIFGGYIGTQIDIAKDTSVNVETQVGNGAWAVCTGIVWKY